MLQPGTYLVRSLLKCQPMSLIKWEPLGDIDRFFNFDFPVMPRFGFDFAVDMYEEKGQVIAEMNLPGVDPDKLNLAIEHDILRVTGSREETQETKKKNYYSKEISRGSFERTVRLPGEVEGSRTEAEYKNGVLKVTMPKKQVSLADKIKIDVKK